jgi:SagB-type dehydrogenase family enzyme
MKKIVYLILLLLFAVNAFSQNLTDTSKLNLDFEKVKNGVPADWYIYNSSQYTTSLDSNIKISGKYSFKIDFTGTTTDFQPCSIVIPGGYDGKKITLSGYIKTENVSDGWAGLWLRIDPSVAFDNMQKKGITGTTDWKKYKITLKLNPEKTKQIVLGGLLAGKGKMWMDNLQVTVDGKDIKDLILLPPKNIKPENEQEKEDSGRVMVKLPDPLVSGTMSLIEALWKRRSVREYKDTCLTIQEVSQLLWAAYGVSDSVSWNGYGLRTAPSAGALYPMEVYLVAGNVSGLPAGVYKYRPKGNYLVQERSGDVRKELCDASWKQEMIELAPASIVYSAVFSRNTDKYGDRGRERYVCMDLGHSGENVYLQATAMGIGTCAIGAFTDEDVSKIMGMPKEEEPLYIMPIGKLKNK